MASVMIEIGIPLHSQLLLSHCRTHAHCMIITDHQVRQHYGLALQQWLQQQGVDAGLLYFPAGEASKTRTTKACLEDQLLVQGYGRDSLILALGGGVVTDLAGFIAATYMRSIDCLLLPTSLMAMVDASIGGKTAVNTASAKNAIGAFHQPQAVLIDPHTLTTLAQHEFNSGLAEIVKHALLSGEQAVMTLKQRITELHQRNMATLSTVIADSIAFKQQIIERDPQDNSYRQVLNLGHTIGHALETASAYRLSHGQAVAWGLKIEAAIAASQCGLDKRIVQQINTLVDALVPLPPLTVDLLPALSQALLSDKKNRNNALRMVLLKDYGEVMFDGKQPTQAVSLTTVLGHCQSALAAPVIC